ncbi:MAG: methylated-DNA--[protein]-cysteine S-methyltransferase, partial [Betaproteobacteria bacterium]
MPAHAFTLFDTTIGRCGIAWSERGIVGVQLPESREPDTRARLLKNHPDAIEGTPPPDIQRALDSIVSLLAGKEADLSVAMLDMHRVPPFQRRVYEAARAIVPGATLSYGELAEQMGAGGSARAVGQALGRNPFAIVVPCHRVLAASGKIGGFSANGGIATKLRMLSIEAARASGHGVLFEGDGAFGFDPAVAVEHLRSADPVLANLIDDVGPFRMQLRKARNIFVALAEAIVYQQLNGRAAASIFARVCALFPVAQGLTAEQVLRISDQQLRGAGLSNSKLLSIRDLARKAVAGEIPTLAEAHRMDDEALIERLTQVRGIGRWTVEMLLISRLGRPDVLPVDDYGIRAGFAAAFRKRKFPAPQDLVKSGAKWKPYRTVASWYLWRA